MSDVLKQEALRRMEYFGLDNQCISAFRNNDAVWQSENGGFLYEVEDDVQSIINDFQHRIEGALVYHVIKSYMNVGGDEMTMYSLLYVYPDSDGLWLMEEDDAEKGIVSAYVYNETIPEFSECGPIYIRPNIGGLVRTNDLFDYRRYNNAL
jgi:hypothetical protein